MTRLGSLVACVLFLLASYSSCSRDNSALNNLKHHKIPNEIVPQVREPFNTPSITEEPPQKRILRVGEDSKLEEYRIYDSKLPSMPIHSNTDNSETVNSYEPPNCDPPTFKRPQNITQVEVTLSNVGGQNPPHQMPSLVNSNDAKEKQSQRPCSFEPPLSHINPPSLPSQSSIVTTDQTVNFEPRDYTSRTPGAANAGVFDSNGNVLSINSSPNSPAPKNITRRHDQRCHPTIVQQLPQVPPSLRPQIPPSQPLIYPPPSSVFKNEDNPPYLYPINLPSIGTGGGMVSGGIWPDSHLSPTLVSNPPPNGMPDARFRFPNNMLNNRKSSNVTHWLDITPLHTPRSETQLGQQKNLQIRALSVPRQPDAYKPLKPFSNYLGRLCSLDDFERIDGVEPISGSFGSVFQVKDRLTGQIFAMKKIVAEKVRKATDNVIAEETIHYDLDHPNIAKFHCTMVAPGTGDVHFLLEYIPGENLYYYMADLQRGVAAEEVGQAIGQISLALRYIHERGIVHRDVKPENIMRTPSGLVKLVDFGLARRCDQDDLTDYAGTAYTTAPEVFAAVRGEGQYGRAADYYSLGSVAYTMFTCERLHKGRDEKCLARRLKTKKGETKVPIPNSAKVYRLFEKLLNEDQRQRWLDVYVNFAAYQRLEIFKGFKWDNLGLLPLPESNHLNSKKQECSDQ